MPTELADLRFLLQVAGSTSLSHAAVRLELSQASASRRLGALEAQWGGRLFLRTGRGLAPTEFGQLVLTHARAVLDRVELLEREVQEFVDQPSGEVALGMLPSVSRRVVPRVLRSLQAQWPRVRLRVQEAFSGDLDEALRSGVLDLAVLNRYADSPAATECFLQEVDLVLLGTAGDAVTRQPEVPFQRLAGLPLALPAPPNALRAMIEQHARTERVAIVEAVCADSLPLLVQLAIDGFCHTIVPAGYPAEACAAAAVQASRIVAPRMSRNVTLSLSPRRSASRAVLEVARCVRGCFD